jgi:4-aminobutyrate aminotransferase-like enzyme
MGEYFRDRLTQMDLGAPATVRVKGLAIGIEFERAEYAEKLVDRCRRQGLLIADSGEGLLTLFPVLTIERKTARQGLDILQRCARAA